MKPTIGRIVHFHVTGLPEQAAIITRVWSERCVNLTVFHHDGTTSGATSIESDPAASRFWTWPPRDGS